MLRVFSFDGSLFCGKDRFYLRINHKRKGIFIMWTLHFRQSPAIFPRFSPLAFGPVPTPPHPAHSFHHAPSSLVMKLRRKRELVGRFLRFPPRFHAYVRAIHARISWFSFFAFTPSPTYRNLFILNQLGVKAFDPKPSRSTSSPVLPRGVVALRCSRPVKER